MSFTDKLKPFKEDFFSESQYLLEEIKEKATKVIEIDHNNWLVLNVKSPYDENDLKNLKDCWMEYAMFSFCVQKEDGLTKVNLIFQGEGPTGPLKEFRHTYWGLDSKGYTFYLPIKATIKALQILNEYFED